MAARVVAASPLTARGGAAAVWTGRQVLVFGGASWLTSESFQAQQDGAAYDPTADSWQLLPPAPEGLGGAVTALWTGSEALIWSGAGVGAAYDPEAGAWRSLTASPVAPSLLDQVVWTGTEVWFVGDHGGEDVAAYNPVLDSWRIVTALPDTMQSDIEDRFASGHAVVWTGDGLVLRRHRGPVARPV